MSKNRWLLLVLVVLLSLVFALPAAAKGTPDGFAGSWYRMENGDLIRLQITSTMNGGLYKVISNDKGLSEDCAQYEKQVSIKGWGFLDGASLKVVVWRNVCINPNDVLESEIFYLDPGPGPDQITHTETGAVYQRR